ncbi:17554_t:CDS:10 [Funneliformis caledonium]|uniref:17554_t:CDS:1 n=1 Tax=Funneliformis caledonium TaxID=1117310 RepID=A0A9N8W3K2_9GLOM|nr:17554_t:CDS:10 [Funneliformis caledonium]
MSLDVLREHVLSSSEAERVEVNQRLLIDNILARYASEFVIYRELMQNSDDAKSSSIQIIFETAHPDTDKNIVEDKIVRILFKNDGFAFRSEDWDRLKRIAEGNPNEQKIGAFGVGFYSLFSVCENPFVVSGGQAMAFYWCRDQLFSRKGLTGDDYQDWTTFLMDMREPIEFPSVDKFSNFLVNSLGFTGNLREISVYFNHTLVIQLSKDIKRPRMFNTFIFDPFSPQRMFKLTSVKVGNVILSVKKLLVPTNNIITYDQMEETNSISLRTISGNVEVLVDERFSAEIERITRKKPPNKTTIQIIYPEFDNSSEGNTSTHVFKDLLSYPEQGKIYIGFPTHQTTGCCSHIAARVIPTMNRDSIDLVEKTLSIYNEELLRITGILCRIVYEEEMFQIEQICNGCILRSNGEGKKFVREWLEKRAAHVLSHFTFQKSTPDSRVGEIIESQFFNCSEQLSVLSTNGVLPISSIRIPDPGIAGIIKQVPIVPNIVFEQCITFFDKARAKNIIRGLTFQDVILELRSRILCEDEMVKLLKWWIGYSSNGNNNDSESTEFKQLAFVRIGDIYRALSTFDYYLNPGIIPPDIDLPIDVFPYSISRNLQTSDLNCLGLSELSLVTWAEFIVNNPNLEYCPTFAERVHNILEKSLKKTSKPNKEIIRQLFVHKKCIPTELGMKLPNEAYFQDVNLFSDLPTIKFQKPLSVQNVMQLLGVRKVVELNLIFDRLVRHKDFDHMKLAKYLASESNHIDDDEKTRLKNIPIWPKEDNVYTNSRIQSDLWLEDYMYSNSGIRRFIISDLHVPIALFRELGLPIIDWKKNWSRNAPEAKFLIDLGLREYPTLKTILELAASSSTDPKIREKALKYFIDNFNEKYSNCYDHSRVTVAFLPCSKPGSYAKPLECFIKPECTIMKFQVVRQDLRFKVEQLGVRQYPSSEELQSRLIVDPPHDVNKAKEIFEFLASQPGSSNWKSLKDHNFIPVRDTNRSGEIHCTNPQSCFLEKIDQRCSLNCLNDFFTFIDFEEKANNFLKSCGVITTPRSENIAELLVKSSRKIWNSDSIRRDEKKYLEILNRVAVDYQYEIFNKSSLVKDMKRAPILAAFKLNGVVVLASADKIFINDDTAYQQIFDPLTAPEDDNLKTMYKVRC